MHRKLDKISREMRAAANEDLWFRNMYGVRVCISRFLKGDGGRTLGKSGNGRKEKKEVSRTSTTLSVMSFPLPKA